MSSNKVHYGYKFWKIIQCLDLVQIHFYCWTSIAAKLCFTLSSSQYFDYRTTFHIQVLEQLSELLSYFSNWTMQIQLSLLQRNWYGYFFNAHGKITYFMSFVQSKNSLKRIYSLTSRANRAEFAEHWKELLKMYYLLIIYHYKYNEHLFWRLQMSSYTCCRWF